MCAHLAPRSERVSIPGSALQRTGDHSASHLAHRHTAHQHPTLHREPPPHLALVRPPLHLRQRPPPGHGGEHGGSRWAAGRLASPLGVPRLHSARVQLCPLSSTRSTLIWHTAPPGTADGAAAPSDIFPARGLPVAASAGRRRRRRGGVRASPLPRAAAVTTNVPRAPGFAGGRRQGAGGLLRVCTKNRPAPEAFWAANRRVRQTGPNQFGGYIREGSEKPDLRNGISAFIGAG